MSNSKLYLDKILGKRYRIKTILGKGGMGTVYLVEDLRLKGKNWALKEILVNKENTEQFIDEVKILISLEHPNLPNIIDYYPPGADGYSYFVMDYINGKTLLGLFEENNKDLPLNKVLKYATQICDLFDYLHNQPTPIIYRDLKPSNIMIDEKDNIRLIDFGIARRYKEGQLSDTLHLGTVGFISPEQIEKKQTDSRSDIFSLGALLFYLLSSGNYFYQSQKTIAENLMNVPPQLLSIIYKMLVIDPNQRYQNITDVKRDIAYYIESNYLDITEEINKNKKNYLYQNYKKNSANVDNLINLEKSRYSLPNKLILICNVSSRAGSTFLSINLAKYLTEKGILTSVIDLPFKPYIFDYIYIEQRLSKLINQEQLQFYSYQHEIFDENNIERNKETEEDGVIWMITDPRRPPIKEEQWSYQHMMKLIYHSKKSNVTIIDVGSYGEHKSIEPLFKEADLILGVIDPLPSEITTNVKRLNSLAQKRKGGIRLEFVVNKWAKGINMKELTDVLKIEPIVFIPFISMSHLYQAVYSFNIPYDHKDIKIQLTNSLFNIAKTIIPLEILNHPLSKETTHKSWFHKWIRKE